MSYKDYKIGQMINVEVVGIQTYGIFTKIDEDTQGLIHISEVEHGYVDNLQELFRIGEKLDVVILDIDEYDGKISLSLRSLKKAKHHPFSNRRKNPRYGRQTGIGFKSLAKMLPKWMEEATERLNKNK